MTSRHLASASATALCCCLFLMGAVQAQEAPAGVALSVLGVSPAPHATAASTVAPIVVRFSEPLDPATLLPGAVRVYGRWSGVRDGTLSLLAGGRRLLLQPARPRSPGEQLTLSLSSALRSRSGAALVGGFTSSFFCAPGTPLSSSFVLHDVLSTGLPGEGLVQSYGIYAGDLNGDGAPDFSIPNETANDVRVLLNDGCGGYAGPTLHGLPTGSTPSANEGQDFDGDGVIDLAVANIDGDSVSIMRGDGGGGFLAPQTVAAGESPRGLVVLDAEGDGDIDIVTANRGSSDLCLLRNDGAGVFLPAELFEGGGAGETALATADADGDGWGDLFVGMHDSAEVTLLLNDGSGGFSLSSSVATGAGPWMLTVGDVHNDGAVDVVSVEAWTNTASVLVGDGAGGLSAGPVLPTGFWPIAVDLGDLDGDGDLDLVTSSIASGIWRVFTNEGDGLFANFTDLPSGTASSCATLVDDDRDGLLDIVGIDEVADEISLWRHLEPQNPGVQSASCEATLRLDAMALSAGFGGRPAFHVRRGATLHLGLSGRPGVSVGLLLGPPVSAGLPSSAGLLNVGEPMEVALIATLDEWGEYRLPVPVGPAIPPGFSICMQALVGVPGAWQLSNPELVLVTL